MKDSFPSIEQKTVIEDAARGLSAMIVAGPGAGKSRTAIEIARRKISQFHPESLHEVLFLSFSNAAVHRLVKAVGLAFSKNEQQHLRFATFHSFAAELLKSYGRFVGLPIKTRVADKLEERLIASELELDCTAADYQKRLFELAKTKGLLSFDVLIPLATSLLAACPKLAQLTCRHFPLIIVDEFQDTSEVQWRFLKHLGAASQVIALGDPNQIIYASMHAATEKRIAEFETWKSVTANRILAKNHRCAETEILQFAECLLTGTGYIPKKDSNVQFGNLYRNELRATIATTWKRIQDKIGVGQTIGILVPSNALVESIAFGLRNPPPESTIRFPVYTQMARDEAACDAVILFLATIRDLLRNPNPDTLRRAAICMITVNTSWTNGHVKAGDVAKAENILSGAMKAPGSPFGQLFSKITKLQDLSLAVNDVSDAFIEVQGFKKTGGRLKAHVFNRSKINGDDTRALYDVILEERLPKGLYGYEAWEGKTHVLTFAKAKGREFDYVIMVVDPRNESSKTPLDEKRRQYYVTATRPKKWVGVLYFGRDLGPVLGPVLNPLRKS